jgi:hypothetical protein
MKNGMHKLLQGIMIVGLCLGMTGILTEPVHAATCTWTGAVSRDWSTKENWSCLKVPVYPSNYDIVIPDVARDPIVTINGTEATANTFTINSGAILEATGSGHLNLVANGAVTNNGSLVTTGFIESAAIDILTAGQFANNGIIDVNAGTVNITAYNGGNQAGTFSGLYGTINLHGTTGGVMTFSTSSAISVKNIYFDNIPVVTIQGSVIQPLDGAFSIYASLVKIYITTYPLQLGAVSIGGSGGIWYIMGGPISGSMNLPLNASLTGAGTITGDLTSAGTVSPGTSPGLIAVNGNYTQESTGDLAIELGGTAPGTGYDQLAATGMATLSGTLDVTLIDSFDPVVGQTFTIMIYGSHTGDFDTVNLPDLGDGLDWQITYGATSVLLYLQTYFYLPMIMR